MIKTSKKIEEVTIGRENAGRYEYKDFPGETTECGNIAYKVEAETPTESTDVYFKQRENAEEFVK